MVKIAIKEIIYLICSIILVKAEVQSLKNQTFKTIFNVEFNELKNGQNKLQHDLLIYFYTPEVDESLDGRQLLHEINQSYESYLVNVLKNKGMKEYQQFQAQMNKFPKVVEVDCGEDSKLCEYFAISSYPQMLYYNKNNVVYSFAVDLNQKQIFHFLKGAMRGQFDSRIIRQHSYKSLFSFQRLVTNHNFIFVAVFIVLPFAYGYFCTQDGKKKPKKI